MSSVWLKSHIQASGLMGMVQTYYKYSTTVVAPGHSPQFLVFIWVQTKRLYMSPLVAAVTNVAAFQSHKHQQLAGYTADRRRASYYKVVKHIGTRFAGMWAVLPDFMMHLQRKPCLPTCPGCTQLRIDPCFLQRMPTETCTEDPTWQLCINVCFLPSMLTGNCTGVDPT